MLTVLLIAFVVMAVAGIEIAFALGLASALAILACSGLPLTAIPHRMVNGIHSYIFIAIPLFLLAGRLMNAGGITDRIFRFARALTGGFYGGLAQANVVATMIFAWMSGSAVATVGGMGEVGVKSMRENGYPVAFAAALAVAASTLGPIIPPSIPLILYGAITEESIGALFLAAVIPGILLGLALMTRIYFISRHRSYPVDQGINWNELCASARRAVLPLLMPVGVIGGLIMGFFTPTEAGAVAVVYALVISFGVYRSIRLKDLPDILLETMVTTAVVTFIISVSSSFSFLLAIENAGDRIASTVVGLTDNRYVILLLFNVLLLLLGAAMEAGVVLILFTPILYPIAMEAGVDPIHFGVIMVVNLMIGVATPPVGVSLFVMSDVSGVRLEKLMREVLPFIWPLLLVLLAVTYIPELALWLPNLLFSQQ